MPEEKMVSIGSIVSSKTRRGMVEISYPPFDPIVLELAQAREFISMLQDALEAATSDALIYEFMSANVGLDDHQCGQALRAFRVLRQGSAGAVTRQEAREYGNATTEAAAQETERGGEGPAAGADPSPTDRSRNEAPAGIPSKE